MLLVAVVLFLLWQGFLSIVFVIIHAPIYLLFPTVAPILTLTLTLMGRKHAKLAYEETWQIQ